MALQASQGPAGLRAEPSTSLMHARDAYAAAVRARQSNRPGGFFVAEALLNASKAHAVEFTIWADAGLREVFERRHGLDDWQAWHASSWLVREVLGNTEETVLFERLQCAVHGHCHSANLLTEAERQRAEAAARQVLQDLQRQDWPRLIQGPRP